MKTKNTAVSLILVAVLGLGGWWLGTRDVSASSSQALEVTGTIEARKVNLSSEIGGKVLDVLVEEGERVSAGQTLVQIDDTLLKLQRDQAQASLDLLINGPSTEQISAAQAQLDQAEANLHLAQVAFDRLTASSRPEEIKATNGALNQARARYFNMVVVPTNDQKEEIRSAVTIAEGNLENAKSRHKILADDSNNPNFTVTAAEAAHAEAESALDVAQKALELANDESKPYYLQIGATRLLQEIAQSNLSQAEARRDALSKDDMTTVAAKKAANATVEDAQSMLDAAKSAYEELTNGVYAERLRASWEEVQRLQTQLASFGFTNPNATSVETLLAQIDAARAARDLAAANLAALQKGTREEQIEAAEAQVKELDRQIEKLTVIAPRDGVILTRSIESGEMAIPGSTLLEIGRLDRLELKVYVPETRIGGVSPGQAVTIQVDSYPDRTFSGTVLRMANEAEFTPTNVQTKEDRTRLVYKVTIGLENTSLLLKPGMIADVTFE